MVAIFENILVQVWLEQMFGDQGVPAYELTPLTVGVLHDLMSHSNSREADTQLLMEELRHQADEYSAEGKSLELRHQADKYSAEGKRIEGILQGVGLTAASLSQSGVMSLRTLANLALALGVKDASDTSYLLALQNLEKQLLETEEARRAEQKLLASLLGKTRTAVTKHAALKRTVEDLEKKSVEERPLLEKQARDTHFISSKGKEYRSQVEKFTNRLKKSGADPTISHEALVTRRDDLNRIKQEIEPMKKKLESYNGLPPDPIQAHIKLDEIKEQVATLEAELMKKIDVMVV